MIEETTFGDVLRRWCQQVGLLDPNEDFPDVGTKTERITVKRARSFIVNFYLGKQRGAELKAGNLDKNVYEPYLTESGVALDPKYKEVMESHNILKDEALLEAGKRFLTLHNAQSRAVRDVKSKIKNRKEYRNKAFVESVLCAWSYVAGLLQNHKERLKNHYKIPNITAKISDPLNAEEMSKFKHDLDPPTYRGLGTRSALQDRQRVTQVFLAKSLEPTCTLDEKFLRKAVSQVVGINALKKGYSG